MIYQIVQPHPVLKPFVKEYMLIHFDFHGILSERPIKQLEARAEQSLIFYPNSTLTKVDAEQNQRVVIPPTIVQGQLLRGWQHHYSEDFKLVKIIFQPGGLYHLLGNMPATHFTNATTDAESVLGHEMNQVTQQLMNTRQYIDMIRVVDTYLAKRLSTLKLRIEPIDRINHLLLHPKLTQRLGYLADQACLSFRQFERKFKERHGVGPKLFARIVRFNHAYLLKEQNPASDWFDIALQTGYADYQHLAKDFKQFSGLTPASLLQAEANSPEQRLNLSKVVVF